MHSIVIFGKEEFALGFMLAGITNIIVDNSPEETRKTIEDICLNKGKNNCDVNIAVIQQETFDELPSHVQEELVKQIKPVVITLSRKGDAGKLREIIMKSIGVDLWQNDNKES